MGDIDEDGGRFPSYIGVPLLASKYLYSLVIIFSLGETGNKRSFQHLVLRLSIKACLVVFVHYFG